MSSLFANMFIEIIKGTPKNKATAKFLEDIESISGKTHEDFDDYIKQFKDKELTKEDIIKALPLCFVEDQFMLLNFDMLGQLCENEGYENAWYRHWLIENKKHDIKAVITDAGNGYYSFISLLEDYDLPKHTVTKEDYNKVLNDSYDDLPSDEVLINIIDLDSNELHKPF